MHSEVGNSESDVVQIKRLFDKTQNNIRRIQEYGGEFYYPVLNEWRFVTEYAVLALGSPTQRSEALPLLKGRLLRAYYDSCLILSDCCLQELMYKIRRIRRAAKSQRELRSVLEKSIEAFKQLQDIRLNIEESGEPNDKQIADLVSAMARLKPVFDLIKTKEDFVRWVLRRRIMIIRFAVLAGIAELLVGLGVLFAMLWR